MVGDRVCSSGETSADGFVIKTKPMCVAGGPTVPGPQQSARARGQRGSHHLYASGLLMSSSTVGLFSADGNVLDLLHQGRSVADCVTYMCESAFSQDQIIVRFDSR